MRRKGFLPMNLQFFAEDTGTEVGGSGTAANSDMQELDNLLGTMGTAPTETGDGTVSTTEVDTSTGQQAAETTETPPPTPEDKQGYAFAQMRTQNNQLIGLVSKIAQAAGIEYKDHNELLAKLNDDAIGKLAKAQNVPVELLKRMEQLETTGKLYEAEQLKTAALVGFQSVKDTYNLDDAELRSFAAELDAKGKNPFLTTVDLESEYKLNHFQDIVKKETQKAVEEALKKSNAADRHSSTPSNANGKPDSGGTEKITTMAGLNSLLNDMK